MTEKIYQFIQAYMAEQGMPPSLADIADGCYTSRSTVLRYLRILEARGWIEREPGKARAIRLIRLETGKER